MPILNTARAPIAIKDYRTADSPHTPTLLIHGAGGIYLDWSNDVRRMPETNAIALDLPGHGLSKGNGRNTIEDYGLDVLALLDSLELRSVNIGGFSMGGAIAQWLALYFPQRVQRLILVGTAVKMPVNPLFIEGIMATPQDTAQKIVKYMWTRSAPASILKIGTERLLQIPPHIIQGDFMACNAFDVQKIIDNIQAPTLVIVGAQDRMTPMSDNQFLANRIPGAVFVAIEGGGHMVMLEQAHIVAEHIRAWLAPSNEK
jgi:pimeloyl-ACP methyl ester carboxylesterase